MEYTVGIYDSGTVPQMCGPPSLSAHYVSVRTSKDNSSISSKESSDYVNIPTAEEPSEALSSPKCTSENYCGLPSAQKLEFAGDPHEDCGDATEHTGVWALAKCSESLSDGEESSQTSNDYVNMTALDLEDIQENQPKVAFQCCRDYENVPSADTSDRQLQAQEVPSSSAEHKEPVWRTWSLGYHMALRPSTQSEITEVVHGAEQSNEDFNDYENVLVADLEDRDWEHAPATWRPSEEGTPSDLAGKLCEVVHPAGSLATETASEDV